MKIYLLLLLAPFLLLTACRNTQNLHVGALTLSTDKPQQGEKISLQYQADSTKLAGNNALEGVLYYAVKSKIYAQAIALSDSGKAWQGSFELPDSAAAFALKFSSGDATDDNNGNGYIFPVYKAQNPIAGALAAQSNFYDGLGSNLLGIKDNADTALALLQKDISAHPGIAKDWNDRYLFTLLTVKKDSAYPEVQEQIKKMLSTDSVSEKDYQTASNLYQRMKMSTTADSLRAIASQKYPAGDAVQNKLAMAFSQVKDVDSMVILYNQFKAKFNTADSRSLAQNITSFMLSRIASAYADKKQYGQAIQYASESNNKSMVANLYNNIAWGLAGRGEDLSFADSLSKASLDLVQQQIDNPGDEKPTYYTSEDWKKMQQATYGNDADTYAMILFKEGKVKEALQYQKQAVDFTEKKNAEINERYAQYLVETGDYASAQQAIEQFMEQGHSTAKMSDYLKTAYVKQKGSDAGYAAYWAGLEAKADERIKEKLRKNMIDVPAKAFNLPDMQGKDISLANLSGKVVVLDFWATWCGPCKASFPGMQKAITQFKNDSNVVFLFVNTWENTQPDVRQKEVAQFIKQNNYSFHVLMDQHQKSDSTQYQVVSDYGVDGIPTKFIIDPQGHVRFKLVGFGGNTDNEVKEISSMIDMLKG